MKEKQSSNLKPNIEQGELFICDLFDAPFKQDKASLEHPVFTVSKKPDLLRRRYEHNGYYFEVRPSDRGIATIYDKDILIYAISKLMRAKNYGEPVGKKLIFDAHEALRFIHRTDKNGKAGGTQFRSLEAALDRLQGTQIKTNIGTGGITINHTFSLIDSATIYRETLDGRVMQWGISLSDWTMNAVLGDDVLTLHPDYFRLRKPIEKRVYEIARFHCRNKSSQPIHLEVLQKKVGSTMVKRNFRKAIRDICETDHLPDYHISIDKADLVVFKKKSSSKIGQIPSTKKRQYSVDNLDQLLGQNAVLKARTLAQRKNRDWYQLKSEFVDLLNSNDEERENIAGSFIGFIKSKPAL